MAFSVQRPPFSTDAPERYRKPECVHGADDPCPCTIGPVIPAKSDERAMGGTVYHPSWRIGLPRPFSEYYGSWGFVGAGLVLLYLLG